MNRTAFYAALRQRSSTVFGTSLSQGQVDMLNLMLDAVLIVGAFVKWCIVGALGIAVGIVMFGESVAKILAWFRG